MMSALDDNVCDHKRVFFSKTLGLVLALGFLAAVLVTLFNPSLKFWSTGPKIPIYFDEKYYLLEAVQVRDLEEFTIQHFHDAQESGHQVLEEELAAEVKKIFDDVRSRLPKYADWYYSLMGQYSRITMEVLAKINLANDGYVETRAAEILFPIKIWEAALDDLDSQVLSRLSKHHQQSYQAWSADVLRKLEPHRPSASLDHDDPYSNEPVQLDTLGTLLLTRANSMGKVHIARKALAMGGIASFNAWSGTAKSATAKSGKMVASRATLHGVKMAAPVAGNGFVACAPSGPYALGCAVIAGAIAWLAVDFALLKWDESIHRDHLLLALEEGVSRLEAEILLELSTAYKTAADTHLENIEEEIARAFLPPLEESVKASSAIQH